MRSSHPFILSSIHPFSLSSPRSPRSKQSTQAPVEFVPGEEDAASAGGAFEADVRAHAGDRPGEAAAGVRFAKLDAAAYRQGGRGALFRNGTRAGRSVRPWFEVVGMAHPQPARRDAGDTAQFSAGGAGASAGVALKPVAGLMLGMLPAEGTRRRGTARDGAIVCRTRSGLITYRSWTGS